MSRKWKWGTVALAAYLSGCASFPANELSQGMPIEEARTHLSNGRSIEERDIANPADATKPFHVIISQFEGERENNRPTNYYLAFQDGRLVTFAPGEARDFECLLQWSYSDFLVQKGKITHAQGEEYSQATFRRFYPEQSSPLLDEYFAYRMLIAGRIDRKESSADEAKYLIAQKYAEITTKAQQLATANAAAAAQTSAARNAAIMNAWQMWRSTQPVNVNVYRY